MSRVDIVAITTDLMDRSRISGAIDGVRVVRPGGAIGSPDVVLVDLALSGALDEAIATGARVIAYGSHVDQDALHAAQAAGAEALPRSVFFRRLAEGSLP